MIVVAIYNMKGGVGKSTTAVNLAYLAAKSGARTLLWDLDAQAASSFAFRVHPQVEGFSKKSLKQTDTLTEAIKATDYDNLDLLPADFAYRKLDQFLRRLGRPERDLGKVLEKLGRGYRYVLLDCPPGLSVLSENVFAAADLILVPTIPTVLSLRALSRLVEHAGHGGNETKVTAFLSMVDRRRALHRHICEWAAQHAEVFLPAQVPYASVIEQMSVRRMPLRMMVPQNEATTAFDTLWCNIQARFAALAPVVHAKQQRTTLFAKAIRDVIATLDEEAVSEAVLDEASPAVTSAATPSHGEAAMHRIKLEVNSEAAFESLRLELSADRSQNTTRLAHIFDTEDGVLLRNGYLLQLLEEPAGFAVSLETPYGSSEPVSQRDEARVATIDGRWAADILAGCLSPIVVLERRIGRPLPKLISAVVAAKEEQPLRRITWRKRLRQHVGPILFTYDRTTVTLHFAFDQINGPGNKVTYEIEAMATGLIGHDFEHLLRPLFSRAGVTWQPLTVWRWPVPANGNNGHRA